MGSDANTRSAFICVPSCPQPPLQNVNYVQHDTAWGGLGSGGGSWLLLCGLLWPMGLERGGLMCGVGRGVGCLQVGGGNGVRGGNWGMAWGQ